MAEILLINAVVIAIAVFVHYEALLQLSRLLPRLHNVGYRLRIVTGVIGALAAHALEILLFAAAYFLIHRAGNLGALRGIGDEPLTDCIYFSLITYTSLGYGDLVPVGDLRFLAGVESLVGLVFIAWTASFLFFEMERYWRNG